MSGLSQMKLWTDLILGVAVVTVGDRFDDGWNSTRSDEMKRICSGISPSPRIIHIVTSVVTVIAVKQMSRAGFRLEMYGWMLQFFIWIDDEVLGLTSKHKI